MAVERIPLTQIKDNPYQPRSVYHKKDIEELASSIEIHGLLQVPPGRRKGADVELAFGHLRKRAYEQLAKKNPEAWGEMPIEIRSLKDEQMAMFALEENLKRADITPMEIARSVNNYLDKFPRKNGQKDLAKQLCMSEGNLSNMVRTLRLPEKFLEKIDAGLITFTQGRELLTLEGLPEAENLMTSAVSGLRTGNKSYGHSNTVEGLQGSIYDVIRGKYPPIDKNYEGWRWQLLFDTRAAGCLECGKMLKTHPTKSTTARYCTDEACWNKHDREHREKAAAAAKKQMEEDIVKRTVKPAPAVAEVEETYRIQNLVSREWWEDKAVGVDDACQKAGWPKEDCWVRVLTKNGGWSNRYGHMPIGSPAEVKSEEEIAEEVAIVDNADAIAAGDKTVPEVLEETKPKEEKKIPKKLLEQAKAAAGTRAEVLDLRPLRSNEYNNQLQSGYALLDHVIADLDDPAECLERCTDGFHYAFDSKYLDQDPSAVCTNPQCMGKKKAALTRKRNAAGQARKKAETKAIKQAVADTRIIDEARLKLVLYAQIKGRHIQRSGYYYDSSSGKPPEIWLWDRLSPGIQGEDRKTEKLFKVIDKLSFEELSALVVEFMFYYLTDMGDVGSWEIKTALPLKWLDIKIEVEEPQEKATAVAEGG